MDRLVGPQRTTQTITGRMRVAALPRNVAENALGPAGRPPELQPPAEIKRALRELRASLQITQTAERIGQPSGEEADQWSILVLSPARERLLQARHCQGRLAGLEIRVTQPARCRRRVERIRRLLKTLLTRGDAGSRSAASCLIPPPVPEGVALNPRVADGFADRITPSGHLDRRLELAHPTVIDAGRTVRLRQPPLLLGLLEDRNSLTAMFDTPYVFARPPGRTGENVVRPTHSSGVAAPFPFHNRLLGVLDRPLSVANVAVRVAEPEMIWPGQARVGHAFEALSTAIEQPERIRKSPQKVQRVRQSHGCVDPRVVLVVPMKRLRGAAVPL